MRGARDIKDMIKNTRHSSNVDQDQIPSKADESFDMSTANNSYVRPGLLSTQKTLGLSTNNGN